MKYECFVNLRLPVWQQTSLAVLYMWDDRGGRFNRAKNTVELGLKYVVNVKYCAIHYR